MPLNNVRPGFNSAVEYAVSGVPHVVSGSASNTPTPIEFPYVTRALTIANSAAAGSLVVGFTQNGVNGSNCFPIAAGQTLRFEIRVRDLWLKASGVGSVNYGVLAELTAIERKNMLPLTGSVDTSTQAGQLMASNSIVWPGVG